MKKSESIKNILPAMLKLQGSLKSIKKGGVNPAFGKSTYSTLADIQNEIVPKAFAAGILIVAEPISTENSIGVQITLYEAKSGEYFQYDPFCFTTAQINQRANAVQNEGGILTYAQRYAYKAIFNLSDLEDDQDANLPQQESPRYSKNNNQSSFNKKGYNYAKQYGKTAQKPKETAEKQKIENAGQIVEEAKKMKAEKTEKTMIDAFQKQTEKNLTLIISKTGMDVKEATQKIQEMCNKLPEYPNSNDLRKSQLESLAAKHYLENLK